MRSVCARWIATSALLMTASASYVACAAVPDLRFVSDPTDTDASADGATDADANINENANEAGANDGSSGTDAAMACTTASPGGGATCCGAIWCIGDCSSTNCDQCARTCQAGQFCCGKTGTVMCKTRCP